MLISTKSFSFLAGTKKRTKKQKKQKTKQNKETPHRPRFLWSHFWNPWADQIQNASPSVAGKHHGIGSVRKLSCRGKEAWGGVERGLVHRRWGRGEANIQPARLLRQTSPENPFHKTPRKPQRLLVFAVVWRDCVNTSETVSHWQTEEGGNHVNRYKMQITTELFHL